MVCVVLVALSASCTKSRTQPRGGEESVSSTSSNLPRPSAATTDTKPPSCGREKQVHGEGYDEAARACLWDAYRAGKTAELELTRVTIEGDPITYTLHVRSGSIDVVEDNRDRFGAHGMRSASCKVLERSPSTNGRSGFIVRGCRGGAETIEVP